jgi:septation ring formation regulator EzrA
MSNSMLTKEEEEQHKDAIIAFTEEVLQARGSECNSRIKISEEQLNEILQEVRQLCKKNRKSKERDNSSKLLYNKQIE